MSQLRQNMALNVWFLAIVLTRDPGLALRVLVNGQQVIADRELQRLLRAF